jgi:diguanylate cyclase (GGDEF)-like protein
MLNSLFRLGEWRFSSRVLLPIIAAGSAFVLFLGGFLLYATQETDRIARERQATLISHRLSESFAKITHDQQASTIWDDAVVRTAGQPYDFDWFDLNLGVWLGEYFGHDRVYLLNAANEPIYAMAAGERVHPTRYESVRGPLAPLVKELRDAIQASPETVADDAQSLSATDLLVVDGRPASVSVVPIVSDSGEIEQAPGTERLHISIRFLDGTFLDVVMQDYLIEGARFSWNADVASDEAAIPLRNEAAATIGHFVWRPNRPGAGLLARTAPVLLGALLLVGAVIAFLVRRLRRASAELQASEAQAQHLAFHDPLTGLANRMLFNDRLDRALVETRRTGARLAILCLDLDRFKNINDTLGHPAGDELIRTLASRLTALVRGSDCVARLGGDEFAILLSPVTGSGELSGLCERIIEDVGKPFQLLGNSAFVGVSIGIAVAPEAGIDRAELMRKADIALYRAKLEGRNRFRIFSDEMDVFVQRRRAVEAELREAVAAGDQLQVVYQPLYAADTEGPVGVEALLRWNHPRHGLVSPGVFIPIAEESGLIHAIGEWVLREACRAATRWPAACRVAVNVSPVQFRSPSFAAKVIRILDETGLKASRLEIEITESVLLDGAELSSLTLNALRAAGVRIALDDFGTGYSSLSYLHKFAVDKIKIDRSFVQGLDGNGAADAIVQAMVDLARAMNVDVTAEGVETMEQRDFLRRIGCDELQGFLLSRPVAAEQIDKLLGIEERPERGVASAA